MEIPFIKVEATPTDVNHYISEKSAHESRLKFFMKQESFLT